MSGSGTRNRHRIGRHLMRDDETGFIHYDDQMVKLWDGTFRHRDNFETRQPQEFVQARADPRALRHIRPEPVCPEPNNNPSAFIGETDVQTPTSPAGHIFIENIGIGEMLIEGTNINTVFKVS